MYIGIDPGKKGGFCLIDRDLQICFMERTPMLGKHYDVETMNQWIKDAVAEGAVAVSLEKVGAMPGQGVTSMFTFGYGAGLWRGLIAAHSLRFYSPTPATWRKVMLADIPRQQDKKAMSIQAAKRLFPGVAFLPTARSKKPHDGMAEAALMAAYTVRMEP